MRAKASCSHFITESTSCKKLRGSLHKTQIARTLDFRAQTDSVLLDEHLEFFQLAHFASQLCKFIFPSAPQVKIIFRSFIEIKASRTWHALRDGQAPAKYQTYHAATYATESNINVLAAKITEFKTEHPKYAAIVAEIPNLDLKETVKGYLAAGAIQKIFKFHAKNLVEEKVANATGASSGGSSPWKKH